MNIKHHTKICRWYLVVEVLKIDINTHLLDFIYFQETIDFSLTSVTSSHVQIWKIITNILDGGKGLIKLRNNESYTFHL